VRQFGLIGFPLSHSFSKGYFANCFLQENILDAHYENYPIESIDLFKSLWECNPSLQGLNVTIPYKKLVIPFLQHPSSVVQSIQACNCIKLHHGALYGYNTDVIGFEKSLLPYLQAHHQKALIFGTGGAAAAVEWVLKKLGIAYLLVS
jgi:shikimate dehydrogenase